MELNTTWRVPGEDKMAGAGAKDDLDVASQDSRPLVYCFGYRWLYPYHGYDIFNCWRGRYYVLHNLLFKFTADNASSVDQREDEEIYVELCGVADTTASNSSASSCWTSQRFRYCNVVVKTAGKITKKNLGAIFFSFEQQAPKPIIK
jgi:hypothetical protein